MACSAAQLAANRANALKSTGPKSPEGKAISRANALKHGMTGAGIVLPNEDAEEVARRFATLLVEMAPKNELARRKVERIAFLTVRLDRCSRQEARHVSFKMRHAVEEFDDARLAAVEHAYSWIAAEPATHARRLRTSPEGIDRLIRALLELRSDICRPEGIRWTWQHDDHLHHLMGLRRMDVPVSRPRALSEAYAGNFEFLGQGDAADLARGDRQVWAADRVADLIEAEVTKLRALREGLDLSGLELDRIEAPDRAMFDGSKEAVLARKYEAATERALDKALKEFREINVEGVQVEPGRHVEVEAAGEAGSCGNEGSAPEDEAAEVDGSEGGAVAGVELGGCGEGRGVSGDRSRRPDPARARRRVSRAG